MLTFSPSGPDRIISAAVSHLPWLGANGKPLSNVSEYAKYMTYVNIMFVVRCRRVLVQETDWQDQQELRCLAIVPKPWPQCSPGYGSMSDHCCVAILICFLILPGDLCNTSSQPEANAKSAFSRWTKAGMPASKLLLGLATYGYVSKSRNTRLSGSSMPSFTPGAHPRPQARLHSESRLNSVP